MSIYVLYLMVSTVLVMAEVEMPPQMDQGREIKIALKKTQLMFKYNCSSVFLFSALQQNAGNLSTQPASSPASVLSTRFFGASSTSAVLLPPVLVVANAVAEMSSFPSSVLNATNASFYSKFSSSLTLIIKRSSCNSKLSIIGTKGYTLKFGSVASVLLSKLPLYGKPISNMVCRLRSFF